MGAGVVEFDTDTCSVNGIAGNGNVSFVILDIGDHDASSADIVDFIVINIDCNRIGILETQVHVDSTAGAAAGNGVTRNVDIADRTFIAHGDGICSLFTAVKSTTGDGDALDTVAAITSGHLDTDIHRGVRSGGKVKDTILHRNSTDCAAVLPDTGDLPVTAVKGLRFDGKSLHSHIFNSSIVVVQAKLNVVNNNFGSIGSLHSQRFVDFDSAFRTVITGTDDNAVTGIGSIDCRLNRCVIFT